MALSDFLNIEWVGKPLSVWFVLFGVVLALLLFDLGLLNRKNREIGIRESIILSAFYIAIGCGFGVWVWHLFGAEKGGQYFAGYLIEKSLSLDNIFVMSVVFAYIGIPPAYQHRVLFWGILGVLVLRGLMIAAGTALIDQFGWVLYIFGGFLVVSGIRLFFPGGDVPDLDKNLVLRLLRRILRITPELDGQHFFVSRENEKTGKMLRYGTPLLLALILIESADVVFAVDSVPAVLVIASDPFIVYASNIFAVIGLRALYFVLAAIIGRFYYLKFAVALILIFIGGKIFAAQFLGLEKIPAELSLVVIASLITGGVYFSLWRTRRLAGAGWDRLSYGGQVYAIRQRDGR